MAKQNEQGGAQTQTPPEKTEKTKQVRVILQNAVLGHKGLRAGDVTDDPEYVALLKTKRGKTLVEEVK